MNWIHRIFHVHKYVKKAVYEGTQAYQMRATGQIFQVRAEIAFEECEGCHDIKCYSNDEKRGKEPLDAGFQARKIIGLRASEANNPFIQNCAKL